MKLLNYWVLLRKELEGGYTVTVASLPGCVTFGDTIEEAIRKADIGINPVNKGESIILNIPPLTEERRKDLVKVVKRLAEEAKISVRQLRQDAQAGFKKKKQNDEMTEDELHGAEKKLQEAVDLENAKIEELTVSKEKAVMTV